MSDKMSREVMLINNEKLFKQIKRETKVYLAKDFDFESKIISDYEYMIRGEAETNFDYKQIIPYGVILNEENKIFVYKRGGKSSNNAEIRLHEKISFGVGGHIEREDEKSTNMLRDALIREIEEEVNIKEENIEKIETIGYINIDNKMIEEFHFAIAYLVKVSDVSVELLDGELDNGEFISIEELENMINSDNYDVELFSKLLFGVLKDILV